jgi:hypothetical protein
MTAAPRPPADTLLDQVAGLAARLRDGAPPAPPVPLPGGIDAVFELTRFESSVLLLLAAAEFDPGFPLPEPTVAQCLALLPEPDWAAFAPGAPLRWWRLVTLAEEAPLAQARLRIDEAVLQHMLGSGGPDSLLLRLLRPGQPDLPLPPSLAEVAAEAAGLLSGDPPPVVQLIGPAAAGQAEIAASAAARLGVSLEILAARNLPAAAEAREELGMRWRRHALLSGAVLLLEVDETEEAPRSAAALLSALGGAAVLVAAAQPLPAPPGTASVVLDVARPPPLEQAALWHAALGPRAAALGEAVREVAGQYALGPGAIRALAAQAPADGPALRRLCRRHLRRSMDGLAMRVEPRARLDDLILPEEVAAQLRLLLVHARQRLRVLEEWGFGARLGRGLGLGALFAGPSGTGKTLAAEAIAGELELEVFRVDLSRVVSKYIGETERNLRRIFDSAECGEALLLFDEADALFGRRTEVKDSHDRYANIEVSFLLSRMEEHRGISVLTTNMRQAMDVAFLRRLRFAVEFPFPDAAERARIWRSVLPAGAPVGDLDFDRLAQLNLPGGHIRNIALGAAFLAAEAGVPIGMAQVRAAAAGEYAKLERPIAPSEVAGW